MNLFIDVHFLIKLIDDVPATLKCINSVFYTTPFGGYPQADFVYELSDVLFRSMVTGDLDAEDGDDIVRELGGKFSVVIRCSTHEHAKETYMHFMKALNFPRFLQDFYNRLAKANLGLIYNARSWRTISEEDQNPKSWDLWLKHGPEDDLPHWREIMLQACVEKTKTAKREEEWERKRPEREAKEREKLRQQEERAEARIKQKQKEQERKEEAKRQALKEVHRRMGDDW